MVVLSSSKALWHILCFGRILGKIVFPMTGLPSETENTVIQDTNVSIFSLSIHERILIAFLYSAAFQGLHGLCIEESCTSHWGESVANIKVTDLDCTDSFVIYVESLGVLVMTPKAIHEELKPLSRKVS